MNPEFFEPTEADYEDLANRLASIIRLVKEEYDYELDQSLTDLEYLQKVVDDELIDPHDRYATECIGMAFGRVLATNEEGMDWWIVEDEYGRDAVIRYGHTSLQIDALHMIGKRLEDGITPDVADLYHAIVASAREAKDRIE